MNFPSSLFEKLEETEKSSEKKSKNHDDDGSQLFIKLTGFL